MLEHFRLRLLSHVTKLGNTTAIFNDRIFIHSRLGFDQRNCSVVRSHDKPVLFQGRLPRNRLEHGNKK